MQDFIELAKRNGVTLIDSGTCQFCGATTQRGIFECMEIFNIGFQNIDYAASENHIYRFFIVDAHTLQHPEVHGRWNNHFHLTRLHLIFKYNVHWTYKHSPKLSDCLNRYKVDKQDELLLPPPLQKRGSITTTEVVEVSNSIEASKELIRQWAEEVYEKWAQYHPVVDNVAKGFLKSW